MLPGGAVVIDDYFYGTLEGVKRCVDDMAVRVLPFTLFI